MFIIFYRKFPPPERMAGSPQCEGEQQAALRIRVSSCCFLPSELMARLIEVASSLTHGLSRVAMPGGLETLMAL